MLLLHNLFHALNFLRVLSRDIIFFANILAQVVKSNLSIPATNADCLPFTHSDRLLFSLFVEFKIDILTIRLLISFTTQSRHNGDTIHFAGKLFTTSVGHCRHHIYLGGDQITSGIRLDFSRPYSNHGDTNPTFV